jgi:hypothetical protein
MIENIPKQLQAAIKELREVAGKKAKIEVKRKTIQGEVVRALQQHQSLMLSMLNQGTADEQQLAAEALLASIQPYTVPHPAQKLLQTILAKPTRQKISKIREEILLDDSSLLQREKDLLQMKAISLLKFPYSPKIKEALNQGNWRAHKSLNTSKLELEFSFDGTTYVAKGHFLRNPNSLTPSVPLQETFTLIIL